MKKVIVAMMLVFAITSINAQENQERTKYFGINPLGLVFNIYSGEFGMQINNKANEINVPFFFWAPTDDITIIGVGGYYRFYKDENGVGFFYGAGASVGSVSWDYTTDDYNKKTEAAITITPNIEGGYRWAWDNGFTIAPTISLGYSIGGLEGDASYGVSGLSWGLGLGLAYMF
jgi:hypothetical protein